MPVAATMVMRFERRRLVAASGDVGLVAGPYGSRVACGNYKLNASQLRIDPKDVTKHVLLHSLEGEHVPVRKCVEGVQWQLGTRLLGLLRSERSIETRIDVLLKNGVPLLSDRGNGLARQDTAPFGQ